MNDRRPCGPASARVLVVAQLRKTLEYLAALALTALILVTVVDVFGRYVLNSPLPGAFEYVRALMALVTFAALPLVCARNEHLRAGILDHMMSPRMNALREPLVQLLSVLVLAGIAWRLWVESRAKWVSKDVLSSIDLPLWIPIAFMMVLSVVAVLVTVALTIASTRSALSRTS